MAGAQSPWGGFQAFSPITRMKFGPGPLGRIGTVQIGTAVALAIVAFALAFINVWACVAVVGIVALLVCLYTFGAFWLADRHPEVMAMDSAHLMKVLMNDTAMRAPPGSQVEAVEPPAMLDVTPVANPRQLAEALLVEGDPDA